MMRGRDKSRPFFVLKKQNSLRLFRSIGFYNGLESFEMWVNGNDFLVGKEEKRTINEICAYFFKKHS